ncbi:MAG: autotransporter outer membrane beta-barrel domain-containing protein [Sutterella sp.]|nr:autotransporter outer membrane beta-barrel domain-containing protein [Sutterella sp.]
MAAFGPRLKNFESPHSSRGSSPGLPAGNSVTPHASLQYTWLRTGSYTSKLNGLNAFHTEASNRHIGSVSAGLKMKADFKFEEGRILRPRMDVYVQPNFRDTEADNVVTGQGLTSTDHVRPETIGDLSYGVSAGLRFITGEMFSSTLSYSFNGSDKSENHAFMLNTSWKF